MTPVETPPEGTRAGADGPADAAPGGDGTVGTTDG
jgi:hypothetical protein